MAVKSISGILFIILFIILVIILKAILILGSSVMISEQC